MPTVQEMTTSLEDARFFHQKIEAIVGGPQEHHDLAVIRRYFRGYLHCWKTVLHFVREAKGLRRDEDWIAWCKRWQVSCLDQSGIEVLDQLRETRDFDTHSGMIVVAGEIAAGLFPIVFADPVKSQHTRRELVPLTRKGLEVIDAMIATHTSVP
jgi:hypothetical protein